MTLWRMTWIGALALTLTMGCATQQPSYESATAEAEMAPEDFKPPSSKTLYAYAKMLKAQGKDSLSEQVLINLLTQDDSFRPAYCELAEIRTRTGRVDEAVEVLCAGLVVFPDDPVLLNNLGMCALVGRQNDLASDSFTQAAGVLPTEGKYRCNLALALGMQGRYEEAWQLYRQVLSETDALENLTIIAAAAQGGPGAVALAPLEAEGTPTPDASQNTEAPDGEAAPTPAAALAPAPTEKSTAAPSIIVINNKGEFSLTRE